MKVAFSSISEVGPRAVNEDSLDCWSAGTGETVACIADGLGGMGGGDVASRLAVTAFRDHLDRFGVGEDSMLAGAREAHRRICEEQPTNDDLRSMATTLTAVALSGAAVFGVHSGDTRAMMARGEGKEMKRLTVDHSEGQSLFEGGVIDEDELAAYGRKHILESALGVGEEPRIDAFRDDLLPGDRVLLTTDGVHDLVPLHEIQRLSAISSTPAELTRRMADAVERRGPTDNFSMIALHAE